MQHTNTPVRHPRRSRALALLLAFALTLGLVPGFPLFSGTASAHWADSYLEQMSEWGFIRSDQAATPDGMMTRADFMAIINRAYGYTQTGPTPFEDVSETDWFYDDVGIAYNANYIFGTSDTTVSPNDPLTRETAATVLGRNMMLKESDGEILDFSDARDISAWAKGTIKSSLEHYLVNGYDDGTFQPQRDLTWGEMAAMVTRIVGTPIQEAGDYSLGGVYGNVTVSSDGVTLRDTVISGDLYVTGGVGLGGVKLENVTVLGRIIASGSGESESGEASIVLRNVTADELLVDNLQNNYVTVRSDGITEIGKAVVRTGAYLEDNTPDGLGLKTVVLEGEEGTRLDLAGRIETVTVKTPNAQVQVAKGTVASLTVDENAPGATVTVNRGAEVKELNLDIGTYVTGEGDVKKLNVNAEGSVVTMLPDEIYIRPGITAVINDQIMDSLAAEEASRDPMILSGYPVASDIAPTSITAVFSTNKKGTIHWAVSAITDGSVATEDLVHPPAYGGISVAKGTVASPQGDVLVSGQVTGLTPGGSYYLAAVLVDDRGQQSPTKVIAFTTPDNTVPAFAEGYPYFSLITNTMAQITVMPTKTCKLYYALLPKGAAAPTESELKTNAVVGNLGYGVRDVVKNTEDVFQVNDQTLEELESYDLYLWLVDADGANKSEIVHLEFTTVDKTPPIFDPAPMVTTVQATSVGLTFQLNEDATVYWVVVASGAAYPKPNPESGSTQTPGPSDPYAWLQIEKGMGNVLKSGSVNATAFKDGTINVSGLTAETAYDLYYVAKDKAGNYTNYGKLTINTLDTNGPKVSQFFTRFVGEDNTKRPTSDTDIVLEFSETVRSTAERASGDSLLKLYNDYKNASADKQALTKLVESVRGSIVLKYLDSSTGQPQDAPVKGDEGVGDDEWAIDYEKVKVAMKNSKLQVTFPKDGLNLDSGITYYFEISELTDTSSNQNPIVPDTVNYKTAESYGHKVPVIEIEFALVNLTSPGVGGKDAPYERRDTSGNIVYKKDEKGDDTNVPEIQEEPSTVDLSFRMVPQSTSRVDPSICYDVLLWSDTSCEYDLYYRILDNKNQPIKNPYADEYKDALLPAKEEYQEADGNGWIYLGYSSAVNPAKDDLAGKSVNGYFNGCDGTGFPSLPNLSEKVRYEFVMTLRKIGTSSNRDTWTGEIHFHNYVAAGLSNQLYTLSRGALNKIKDWEDFQKGGLSSGARSIGVWNNEGTTYDYIDVRQLFTNVSLPEFSGDTPTFAVTDTSVTMSLALDNPGDIYYVIGKANPSKLPNGKPEITTTIGVPDSSDPEGTVDPSKDTDYDNQKVTTSSIDEWHILGKDVPYNGTGNQPHLIQPDPQNIFNPSGWAAASRAKTGTVNCPGVTLKEEPVEGLETNTTYYAYFVIKGAAQELSRVYVFQFTTESTHKPRILMNALGTGDVEFKTDVASNGYYRIISLSDVDRIPMLSRPFNQFVDNNPSLNGKAVPTCYMDDSFTLLKALTSRYNYEQARNQSDNPPPGQTKEGYYFFPSRNGDYTAYNELNGGAYTVFDIYANNDSRDKVYGLVRDGRPGYDEEVIGTIQWGPFGPTQAPVNYGNNTLTIGSRLGSGRYIILSYAQNTAVSGSYLTASFRAGDVQKSTLSHPDLTGVGQVERLSQGTSRNLWSGKISFTFNTILHVSTSSDPDSNDHALITPSNLKNGDYVTMPTKGDISFSSVTQRGFTLELNNVEMGQEISFDASFFRSSAGDPAPEKLTVELNQDAKGPFITVTWGQQGVTDHHPFSRTDLCRPLESTGGRTITLDSEAPIKLEGNSNSGFSATLDAADAEKNKLVIKTVQVVPEPVASDGPVGWTWEISTNNVVTIDNRFAEKPTFTAVGIGTTLVTLTVTVGNSEDSTQTLRITVDGSMNIEIPSTLSTNTETMTITPTDNTGSATCSIDWKRKDNTNPAETLTADLGTGLTSAGNTTTWKITAGNSVVFSGGTNAKEATGLTPRIVAMGDGETTIVVTSGAGDKTLTKTITVTVTSDNGNTFSGLTPKN